MLNGRRVLVWILALVVASPAMIAGPGAPAVFAQVPFQVPPRPPEVPENAIPPNTEPLSPAEVKRAEALLPLLSGNQELWAMGEFVHLGAPVVPVLVKALKMADPRLRYNAIETMSMINEPAAARSLVETAMEPNEMIRVREHALRVAVRLDPPVTVEAISGMAEDESDSIRKTAAFESRYVREKGVIPVLIGLLKDEQRFVAITAVQSLWQLTRHETTLRDWAISTPGDRAEWAKEWIDWWEANKDTFELPQQPSRRRPA